MKTGLLWYDDDPKRSLPDKVRLAVRYYREKHGHEPNVCYIHRAEWEDGVSMVDGVVLRTTPYILAYHMWLGVEDDAGEGDLG